MKELDQDLEAVEKADATEGSLRATAIRWGSHAINTYRDELLHRALAISEALAQFVNESETMK